MLIHWNNDEQDILSFDGAEEIGIHTKHLVSDKQDERGPGISFRRNDTKEEFYFLHSGEWKEMKFIWG